MDLYKLLPAIIRFKDRLGSGVTDTTEETVLQKFFYALEQECDTTDELTAELPVLFDPSTCDEQYLPLLENLLGSHWPGDWPESRRRLVISSLVDLYHHSGQHLSWTSILNLLGYSGFFPWELWKQDVFEKFDYSLYGYLDGYYGLYHSARIDVRDSSGTLKVLTDTERELLDRFRPIHVLIRAEGDTILDQHDIITKLVQDAPVADASGVITDEFLWPIDRLSVAVSCIALCEIGVEPT